MFYTFLETWPESFPTFGKSFEAGLWKLHFTAQKNISSKKLKSKNFSSAWQEYLQDSCDKTNLSVQRKNLMFFAETNNF